jgi:hypothetical protein
MVEPASGRFKPAGRRLYFLVRSFSEIALVHL